LSTQTTSIPAVTARVQADAPLAQVYYLFSTRSGWLDWFGEKAFGHVQVGSVLEVHQSKQKGALVFIFKELVRDERMTFDLLELKTQHTSRVEVTFKNDGSQAAVQIEHRGMNAEDTGRYQEMWQTKLDGLRSIVETGKHPEVWNRPFLGVMVEAWVDEEFAAEHELPVTSGMRVSSVFEGKGADQAGIRGGDTIVSLAGIEIVDFESLLEVYKDHRAGDTIEAVYYQGDSQVTAPLTLAAYPVPEVPATAQDIADKLAGFFTKVTARIEQLLADKDEAQFDYRPAAGEWNAKEIIAHMIASESDALVWLGSYIAGREVHPYISTVPARLKGLLAVYPSMGALLKKLAETQKELVAQISESPAEVVSRKSSLTRMAMMFDMDVSLHYRDHLAQLKETLAQAEDVRG
jgi:hypothetical protein